MVDIEEIIHFAKLVHLNQVDKAGRPYIEHVLRVMGRIPRHDVLGRMVAVLHDTMEDGSVTSDDLVRLGVPGEVIRAVKAITHLRGEPNEAYWKRVAGDPLARRVKIEDIGDNLDEGRLAALPEQTAARLRKKYAKALEALG